MRLRCAANWQPRGFLRLLMAGVAVVALTAGSGQAAIAGPVVDAAPTVSSATTAPTGDIGIQSAYGIQTWGQFCVSGKCFPSGVLEHSITGSGRTVTYEWAEAEAAANICNWRMDFTYYDTNAVLYSTSRGSTHYTCTRVAYRAIGTDRVLRYGRACANIYANGIRLARQCHSITS